MCRARRYLGGEEDVLVKVQGHHQSGVGVQRRALAAALDLADLALPDPRVHSQLLLRLAQRMAAFDQQVDQAVLDLQCAQIPHRRRALGDSFGFDVIEQEIEVV